MVNKLPFRPTYILHVHVYIFFTYKRAFSIEKLQVILALKFEYFLQSIKIATTIHPLRKRRL